MLKAKFRLYKLLSYFIPGKKRRRAFKHTYCHKIVIRYEEHRKKHNWGYASITNGRKIKIADKRTIIGKYCSISSDAFIGTQQHPTDYLSTHPFMSVECPIGPKVPPENIHPYRAAMPCHIGNDVWVGRRAIILDGITVGDGAIIAAGAVVTHDVEPYAIVGGVPAKLIRYRFEKNIISDLLELKWWDCDEEFLTTLPFPNVKECIEKLKEYRAKHPLNQENVG